MKSVDNKGKVGQKKIERTFKLEVKLPRPLNRYAWDVIRNIEHDELLVFDLNHAISMEPDKDGYILPNKTALKPVSIKEWLPVGCQQIRVQSMPSDDFESDSMIACYKSNAMDVITPIGTSYLPVGPSAFHGEIIIGADFLSDNYTNPSLENKLKFILAHELVHVFHLLRMLIPAFQNWKKFWNVCLDEGDACSDAATLLGFSSIFLDNYGSKDELVTVREYWPQKAEKWFTAFRS